MTESPELTDRPRLMALVFGLRLCVLSLALLVLFGAVFAAQLSPYGDFEAVAVIYSIYQLMIAMVLVLIRLRFKITRVMILAPLTALLLPGWKLQLFGALVGGCLALEGFRLEASLQDSGRWFVVCQGVLIIVALTLLVFPSVLAVGVLGGLVYLGFGVACWRWQDAIKEAMKKLD